MQNARNACSVFATSAQISDLLLVAKIPRPDLKIGIIANRVRANTRVYGQLKKFLSSLDIPVVATLRDSQNYTRAFEFGMGIHEMPFSQVKKDIDAWSDIMGWLDRLRERNLGQPSAIHYLRG